MCNIMRKIAFIINFILLLTACSKGGSDFITPPAGEGAISFDESQTRAALNTVSSTFSLYGIATDAGNTSIVFNNQKVEYDTESNSWVYFPLKYWNLEADYKFAAYAPYNFSHSLSLSPEGYPMITNFMVLQDIDNQESLLLSRLVERNIVGDGQLDTRAVKFTFEPALTRINFKIKKELGVEGIVNLNALRMYNLKSSGNCVHNGMQIVWDTSFAPTNSFGYSTNFPSAQEVSFDGIIAWQRGLLMVPQQISSISVSISYTHRPTGTTYSYDKENIALPGANWEAGKQITYVLTLKPENNIEIGEPVVEPWIEGSTGGGVIIIT